MNESKPQVEQARRRLIFQLTAAGHKNLAEILNKCTEDHPCGSGACPSCGVRFQHAAVELVRNLIQEPAKDLRNRVWASTLIPASGCVGPGKLSLDVYERTKAEVRAALEASKIGPTVAGVDVSFNEDRTGEVPPHWCVHTHSFSVDWLSAEQEKDLHSAIPKSEWVKKPVWGGPFDGDPRGPFYAFEPERERRETYLNTRSGTGRNPHRDTRGKPLRPSQAVELAQVEHGLGWGQRLLFHGIEEGAVERLLEGLGWARDGP